MLLCCALAFAQDENPEVETKVGDTNIVIQDTVKSPRIDPLRPSKAAFYSAILPGLGQAYNKKYWKIPIVVGMLNQMGESSMKPACYAMIVAASDQVAA